MIEHTRISDILIRSISNVELFKPRTPGTPKFEEQQARLNMPFLQVLHDAKLIRKGDAQIILDGVQVVSVQEGESSTFHEHTFRFKFLFAPFQES